ncbi:MAG TPA: phosphate ABC transporter ATP-binding protein [Elusimicrobia bacterium]|jgi:phosphate transport system ATP-binding protein|nr:phosphate ABC transporter ATP-binding protein [Elusimicrobiota bacterium]
MEPIILAKNLNAYYHEKLFIRNLNLDILPNEILTIIGPANSGKTTFLRCLNRLNDLIPYFRLEGEIFFAGQNIYANGIDVSLLRRHMGMVFANPIPLPYSIFENVAFAPQLHRLKDKKQLAQLVEKSLKAVHLWDEVKSRLPDSALKLSGGQQQRLCLARVLALEPQVLLLDEPTAGLDPISTAKIEDALYELKKEYTIILVTNNIKQAARVADKVAFFLMGELVEYDTARNIFTAPKNKKTEEYLSGRFG